MPREALCNLLRWAPAARQHQEAPTAVFTSMPAQTSTASSAALASFLRAPRFSEGCNPKSRASRTSRCQCSGMLQWLKYLQEAHWATEELDHSHVNRKITILMPLETKLCSTERTPVPQSQELARSSSPPGHRLSRIHSLGHRSLDNSFSMDLIPIIM